MSQYLLDDSYNYFTKSSSAHLLDYKEYIDLPLPLHALYNAAPSSDLILPPEFVYDPLVLSSHNLVPGWFKNSNDDADIIDCPLLPTVSPHRLKATQRTRRLFKNEFIFRCKFRLRKDLFVSIVDSFPDLPSDIVAPFTGEFYALSATKYKPLSVLKNRYRSSKFSAQVDKDFEIFDVCRLNIEQLAVILGLEDYDIELTKEIELNILEIFTTYCKFNLGYQTWIRDTSKLVRSNLINQLYLLTYYFYPEINKSQLEAIVKKGCYNLMQSRLRRGRRRG